VKSGEDTMEILEAFHMTGSYRDAAELPSRARSVCWVCEVGALQVRPAELRPSQVEATRLAALGWPTEDGHGRLHICGAHL
jgi:hypothetical protein